MLTLLHRGILIAASAIPFVQAASGQENASAPDTSRARIAGIVVDATNLPVAGAEVRTPIGSSKTESDHAGRFSLTLEVPMVSYSTVFASAKGGTLMGMWIGDDTDLRFRRAIVDGVRIVLKPSQSVVVKVVDALGQPVPGAAIGAQESTGVRAISRTDDSGKGTLTVPEDARISHIVAAKSGKGFDYFDNTASTRWRDTRPLPASVTLTLDGASRFQVRALDAKRQPVAGVQFGPWYLRKLGMTADINLCEMAPHLGLAAVTDAQGLATLDAFPVTATGRVPLIAFTKQDADEVWTQPRDPDWVHWIPGAAPPVLEATLWKNATVSGLVLHADGKPASGILLQAEGQGRTNDYDRKYARTRADGTFEMKLSPEMSYLIAVTEEDWSAPSVRGFVVREGEERNDLLFTLGKGTLVQGVARHSSTDAVLTETTVTVIQRGQSIDTAALRGSEPALTKTERLVRWTKTDAQGRYTIRLGPGIYDITAGLSEENRPPLVVEEQPELQHDMKVFPHE